MKTEANVWENSRADQIFYKIIIFCFNKKKDFIRSAYVYLNFFHETVNFSQLGDRGNHNAHVIFVLHSTMKTHLTDQNTLTIQVIINEIKTDSWKGKNIQSLKMLGQVGNSILEIVEVYFSPEKKIYLHFEIKCKKLISRTFIQNTALKDRLLSVFYYSFSVMILLLEATKRLSSQYFET